MANRRDIEFGSPEHCMVEDLVKTGFESRISGDPVAVRVGKVRHSGGSDARYHEWNSFFVQVKLGHHAAQCLSVRHKDYMQGELITGVRVYFFVHEADRRLLQENCYENYLGDDDNYLAVTPGARVYLNETITITLAPTWGGTYLVFDEYNNNRITLSCRVGDAIDRENLHHIRDEEAQENL